MCGNMETGHPLYAGVVCVRVWVLSKGIHLDMDVCLYVHVRAGKGTCGPSYAHVSVTVWRAAALWVVGGKISSALHGLWVLSAHPLLSLQQT